MCRVDLRGTGTSEGIAAGEYLAREHDDLVEVIDWLTRQEWSTGSVGMFGTSYSGFNSIQTAMRRPPGLKAIIPIYATDPAWKVTYRGFVTMFHKRAELNRYINAKPNAVPVWYFGDIPTD